MKKQINFLWLGLSILLYLISFVLPYYKPFKITSWTEAATHGNIDLYNAATGFTKVIEHTKTTIFFLVLLVAYFVLRKSLRKLAIISGTVAILTIFYLVLGYIMIRNFQETGFLGGITSPSVVPIVMNWGFYAFALASVMLISWLIRDMFINHSSDREGKNVKRVIKLKVQP
ncbi:hypothetical protein [Lactococcus protaetiae]|uniref:Uncharacterized protein n=1 Tax=Lactococcus protaetiae TaxID=2592653 RepID=A0A514Z652_9LACT|nr:hypothetical protein [Lactococcus protaetiae]MCL2114231.1 hypothetical protein [Streptococcaceae bacterium]QDK70081.1 hypothetical protein FLP15_01450 [Lactococcus protaetiae]